MKISSNEIKKWYQHMIWNLRNRTFVLWFRAFGAIFVIVIAIAIAWVIVFWYKLFYTPALTQVQIEEVRRQNAPVVFNKEQFQNQIKNKQLRRDAVADSASVDVPDIFYPDEYPRSTKP